MLALLAVALSVYNVVVGKEKRRLSFSMIAIICVIVSCAIAIFNPDYTETIINSTFDHKYDCSVYQCKYGYNYIVTNNDTIYKVSDKQTFDNIQLNTMYNVYIREIYGNVYEIREIK